MRPELTFDPEADAVFVRLSDAPPTGSEEVSPGVTLDFDAEGRVVALEFLPASTLLAPGDWSNAPLPGTRGARHAAE
jgi:uncharacterized protein YuzE